MVRRTARFEVSVSPLIFYVDENSDWLWISFAYEETKTWGEMRIRDPHDRLRFSYMDVYFPREALLHRDYALTSDLGIAGCMEAGAWKIEFLRQPPQFLELTWEYGSGAVPPHIPVPSVSREYWTEGCPSGNPFVLNLYDWNLCRERNRRWYKGDLHGHTLLSDGKKSPQQMMEQAEMMNLDFLFTTEHNLLPSSWPAGKTLVIPGMEITSYRSGDWNALGLKRWIDAWGTDCKDRGMNTQEGQNRLMEEVAQMGALRTLNHPLSGRFSWRYEHTPLRYVDLLEVWHAASRAVKAAMAERMLNLWSVLWNDGYRIPGIGGSDTHLGWNESYDEAGAPDVIGDPGTFVWADELSPAGILSGLRAGHVYVSRGPACEVAITAGGRIFTFGDDVTEALIASEDKTIRYELRIAHALGARLHVIENGRCTDISPITSDPFVIDLEQPWKPETYVWRRFEIRGPHGELLGFSNPVSAGTTSHSVLTWGQLLEKAGIELD